MDRLKKFLAKLDRKMQERVALAIECIQARNTDRLDIKPLQGMSGHFRCRVGNIRVLFFRRDKENVVYDADSRGNIYKK